MTGAAIAAITLKIGAQTPFGRRDDTALSGTNKPSSMMSFEPEARMAIVRQVSRTLRPGAFSGTAKYSTVGRSFGSSYRALVNRRSPIGEPLLKVLRAVTR